MDKDYPTFGSQWRHNNGHLYTVLGTANAAHENVRYPVTIVYVGQTGNLWTKPLYNFRETMTKVDVIT